MLPVAFGEATKTVPIVQEGAKAYRFRVRWGEETATDDAEGEIVARSDARPSPAEIAALLPRFTGLIEQTPPMFSAIKIDGARAYDLAREGRDLRDRSAADPYLSARSRGERAGLRDLRGRMRQGRLCALHRPRPRPCAGCFGHVIELRRMRVGPFSADNGIPLNSLPDDQELMARAMLPLQAGLVELPMLPVDHNGAGDVTPRASAALAGLGCAAGRPRLGVLFRRAHRFRRCEGRLFRFDAGIQHAGRRWIALV